MRAHLPTEIVHSIRVSIWHALFRACGYPPGLDSSTVSHDAIASALAREELPLPLARALFTIAAFATDAGRTDLYNAADALGRTGRWPDAESPSDLVALLLAASHADDATVRLLAAGQTLRNRAFRPRATLTHVGARPAVMTPGGPAAHAMALRSAVGAWARERDFGDVLPVRVTRESDTTHYEILHEDRWSVLVSLARPLSDHEEPSILRTPYRALRSHLLTLQNDGQGLWITTDSWESAMPLARIAGSVFFGDPRYFLDAPGVDLSRMQDLGEAALEAPELAALLAALAVGGTWHSGKGYAMTPRGKDFFDALKQYNIRIDGGRLDLVTLRARINAALGAPPSADISLRPPHLATISEPEHAPLLRKYLDLVRITHPAPRLLDFISMQPWIDVRAVWVAAEGEEGFAFLVKRGILNPDTTNRAVTPPDHPHAGRTATAHPLHGTTYIAWSADLTIPPFLVQESDLVVYALSFANLARLIAEALGLESPASELDDDGVLYCGRRPLASTHVLVYLPTRPIRAVTAARLRETAEHGHAVLISPAGRKREQGLREITMPKLAGPWRPLLGDLVRALHVERFVDTTLYAPADARFVLHRATLRTWVDGVACTAVTESQFRLVEILLDHAGQPVHTKDVAAHITRGNFHEDTTRRAIEGLLLAIGKSFRAQKKKPPKDLASLITMPRRGYYVLNAVGFAD